MKKLIFCVLTAFLIVSCQTTTVIFETQREAIVEEITANIQRPSKGKRVVTAWSYKPTIKKYTIYTDYPYNVGDTLIIKGK